MGESDITSASAFDKARAGLWNSLQKHLVLLYAAETAFTKAASFAEAFPFSPAAVPAETLHVYWQQRHALQDLHTDETAQLDTLTKAIRTKGYAEDDKKQLYLLLLGYLDIAAAVFSLLDTHIPSPLPKEEEWEATKSRFERVKNFARLNVKGMPGLLRMPVQ